MVGKVSSVNSSTTTPKTSSSTPTSPPKPSPSSGTNKSGGPNTSGGSNSSNGTNGSGGSSKTPTTSTATAIKSQQTAAQKSLSAAQTQFTTDQQTVQSTNAQIKVLGTGQANAGKVALLQAQLKQEQAAIQTDQQQVNAAQAKVDAFTFVSSGDQANTAQQSGNLAYTAVAKSLGGTGINLPNNGTLTQAQYNSLTTAQKTVYINYIATLTQTQAYAAVSNQAYAQLQLYASSAAKYGSIASDAVDAVNKALQPLGLQVKGPNAIDPNTAQQNYDTATKQASYWTNAANNINSFVAGPSTTASSAEVDAKIAPLLTASQQSLTSAQTEFANAKTAVQTTQAQIKVLGTGLANAGKVALLQGQLTQEEQAVEADQSTVNTDQAQIDATSWILSGDKATAAQKSGDAVYNTLMESLAGSGINLKNGATLSQDQYGSLTLAQQSAYLNYIAALTKTQIYAATSNQAYAQLQLFVSDQGQYGSSASDATNAVNSALQPLGLQISVPDAIDAKTAARIIATPPSRPPTGIMS